MVLEVVEDGQKYVIGGESPYFKRKYGTENPTIIIEADHKDIFGVHWSFVEDSFVVLQYEMRALMENLPPDSPEERRIVFLGQIRGRHELVHISELEEI